jgi:hypothetical protein
MSNHNLKLTRRHFLTLSASATLLILVPEVSYAKIIREIEGTVWINQDRATLDAVIQPGDTITTGDNSKIIFVMGQDVYKLGSNSVLKLQKSKDYSLVKAMRVISGALTAVFAKGEKEIYSPTAALGIRGTGLFLKIEQDRTYFCNCYGKSEVVTTGSLPQRRTLSATHHQACAISHDTHHPLISSDTLREHQDKDLIYLEAFVGRKPPF